MKNNRKKQGFTLAELLIVVAIIAILVAVAIPVFAGSLEKAKLAVDHAAVRDAYALVQIANNTQQVDFIDSNGVRTTKTFEELSTDFKKNTTFYLTKDCSALTIPSTNTVSYYYLFKTSGTAPCSVCEQWDDMCEGMADIVFKPSEAHIQGMAINVLYDIGENRLALGVGK